MQVGLDSPFRKQFIILKIVERDYRQSRWRAINPIVRLMQGLGEMFVET